MVGKVDEMSKYEELKAERNRLKNLLEVYKHMKGSRTYLSVKQQYDMKVKEIKSLFKMTHA